MYRSSTGQCWLVLSGIQNQHLRRNESMSCGNKSIGIVLAAPNIISTLAIAPITQFALDTGRILIPLCLTAFQQAPDKPPGSHDVLNAGLVGTLSIKCRVWRAVRSDSQVNTLLESACCRCSKLGPLVAYAFR